MIDEVPPRVVLTERYTRAVDYARTLHSSDFRKGTRIPYLAHLLSVSALVIEGGGDEDQAIAALLHDAAEDHRGQPRLDAIRAEFGDPVAEIVEACSDSLTVDPSTKQSWWERKVRYLRRLEHEDSRAALVSCADKLHNARAVLDDYRRDGEQLWTRFNADAGRRGEVWYFRRLADILPERLGTVDGRPHPLGVELHRTVGEIQSVVAGNNDVGGDPVLETEWEQSRDEERRILEHIDKADR